MKDMNYRVIQISRSRGTASNPFEPVVNIETIYPLGYYRWYSEANLVAQLLAKNASEYESVNSDPKWYAVQKMDGLTIITEHLVTFKTPEPVITGGADIEWEPYDGVPADTIDNPPANLAADTF